MTTAVEKPLTPTQRVTEAMKQACAFLELSDSNALKAALVEAALDGVQHNSSFAAHVRALYESMARPKRVNSASEGSRQVSPAVELTPRPNVPMREANPAAPPDPYYLNELYGAEQLPLALARYKVPKLKLAAELVQQRNPGTKPKNKGNRDALIDYIVAYVAF